MLGYAEMSLIAVLINGIDVAVVEFHLHNIFQLYKYFDITTVICNLN